jgi:hypothetical protein
MKHELRHFAFKPTIGGRSVPADQLINDLEDMAVHYVGTFSEYNILFQNKEIIAYVYKNWTRTGGMQKAINLPGLNFGSGKSYAGGELNSFGQFGLNKQDLLRIANAMDDTDTFFVSTLIL